MTDKVPQKAFLTQVESIADRILKLTAHADDFAVIMVTEEPDEEICTVLELKQLADFVKLQFGKKRPDHP